MRCKFQLFVIIAFALCVSRAQILRADLLEPTNTWIVCPTNPKAGEIKAGELLNLWLKKACRAPKGFEVVDERQAEQRAGTDAVLIALGNTKWADSDVLKKLSHDGYALHRKDNIITIVGGSDDGTFYGAAGFLDRVAGVRFYLPDPMFVSLPKSRQVHVDQLNVLTNPFVTSCFMSAVPNHKGVLIPWVPANAAWRRKGGTHQHNMFALFPPEKFAASHPGIYPIIKGKRHIPETHEDQGWQPNFLSPDTMAAAEISITDYFAQHPDHDYIAVSINDSHAVSEDEKTQAILADFRSRFAEDQFPEARATSHIFWQFVDKLATRIKEKFPEKRIVSLAYAGTRFAPSEKLPDNVVVFTNFHIAELPADGFLKESRRYSSTLDDWLNVAKYYGNHDWYQGRGYAIPRIYSGYWTTFMRALQSRIDEAYMHAESYPNWGLDGPKLFILSRLWWDPQVDPDAILKTFSDDMFGSAAPAMYDYFVKLEQLWEQLNIVEGPERKLERWSTQFNTTEKSLAMIADCRALLDKATSQATNPDDRARVTFFADHFLISESLFYANAGQRLSMQGSEKLRKTVNQLSKKYPWATTFPEAIEEAIDVGYDSKMREQFTKLGVRRMSLPRVNGQVDAKEWADATEGEIQLGKTMDAVFLAIRMPDIQQGEKVEISINLSGKLDAIERQFHFDYTGKLKETRSGGLMDDALFAKAKLHDKTLHIEAELPNGYLDDAPVVGTPVNLQIRRLDSDGNALSTWMRRLSLRSR